MILLLTLKPAAVWAAEDQKQEETEVPEESRTQEDRELNQVAAEVSAPHALLMEVSTGTVLMEKAADEKVHPASVTKIMTLLLILEALAQTGAVAILSQENFKGKTAYFGGLNNVKFKHKVVPGDRLRLECEIIKQKGPVGVGKATATVDGKIAVVGELTFMIG